MVETGYRQLIVLRHAKTEQEASSDRVRELTARGRRDAQAAGRWLSGQEIDPDLVLTSPAARALSTANLVCDQLGTKPEVRVVEDLYGASVGEVLDVLAAAATGPGTGPGAGAGTGPTTGPATGPGTGGARRVMVVGHNPTMEDLVHELQREVTGPWADHLPTAGIAVLNLSAGWADLGLRSADLTEWYVPRG